MRNQISNCSHPTICQDGILSDDNVYASKEKCSSDCINKGICMTILHLLSMGDKEEAINHLKNINFKL